MAKITSLEIHFEKCEKGKEMKAKHWYAKCNLNFVTDFFFHRMQMREGSRLYLLMIKTFISMKL